VAIIAAALAVLPPAAAALEHHRIVPQSELVMLEGDHFMTFLEAERIASPVGAFLDRVEAGTATVRANADRARTLAAADPFDPLAAPPVAGFALFITLLLIALATFVSEDLTCIGTGLLIARGSLPWTAGVGACLVGLVVGDLLLYAGGRVLGRPVSRVAPLRWLIRREELERACRWFTRRGAALLLAGRFVPGTRLPTYVAAGVVRMPVLPFSLWILVAAALWTPLLVGGTALFGTAAAERVGAFQDRALLWLAATALAALIVFIFLFNWDNFLWPLVVLNSPEKQTLPLVLAGLRSLYWTRYEMWAAGSMLTVVPVMLIYIFASKYFIRGLAMTGLKA